MATTKTLTPTNQAITIAAFTEKPDNRVNATNDDKMADAINTLNSNINKQRYSKEYNTSSVTLAQIQSDADTLAGDEVGIYDIGYLNGTAATAIGVGIGACFVQLIKHTSVRQILLFTSIATGEYAIVKKDSSTWSSTFANPITPVKNWINPTMPDEDVTLYDTESTYYTVCGHIIMLSVSIKITNAQTGFANRKLVTLNIPSSALPHKTISITAGDGGTDGYTLCSLGANGILAIYPQKAGTTYAQFAITYIK